jgi:hypothetical protein
MHCPHCRSAATTGRKYRTVLGYWRFNCRASGRRSNERTGTPWGCKTPSVSSRQRIGSSTSDHMNGNSVLLRNLRPPRADRLSAPA